VIADGDNAVTIPATDVGMNCSSSNQIRFWQDREKTQAATSDEDAEFVEVFMDPKTITYALTPIGGAIGPELSARAMAGIGSAICKVPPVMMCNPAEPLGNANTELDFDADALKGVGIRLVSDGAYTPGAFGFIETSTGSGANNLLAALGWESPPGDCAETDSVAIKPGMNASVIDGLNTRFDIPGAGNSCPSIGGVSGSCPPSVNVRKDLVRGNSCNGPNAWTENPSNSTNFLSRNYRPQAYGNLPSSTTPQIMGHPRDLCHAFNAVGDCNARNGGKGERFGTGDWDINAYWRANYGGSNYGGQVLASTYGSQPKGYPTRYQVYRWEADNLATTIGNVINGQGGNKAYAQPQAGKCLATASSPYGIVPVEGGLDRRRISVAVLNCNALKAKYGNSLNGKTLEVGRRNWADLFLVEPSYGRFNCTTGTDCNVKYSDKTDVYVEVIGRTDVVGGGQTLTKDTPYLIE
jgi:hypothetical protein